MNTHDISKKQMDTIASLSKIEFLIKNESSKKVKPEICAIFWDLIALPMFRGVSYMRGVLRRHRSFN
jgi:hypothetical protein